MKKIQFNKSTSSGHMQDMLADKAGRPGQADRITRQVGQSLAAAMFVER